MSKEKEETLEEIIAEMEGVRFIHGETKRKKQEQASSQKDKGNKKE